MSTAKLQINQVFTPRKAIVNPAMYISRPQLEKELKRAVGGSLHSVLTGESGSGKSWLHKHVAQAEGWRTVTANAGNAIRNKSLAETIAMAVHDDDEKDLVEYTQKIDAKAEVFGIGGGAEAERKYEFKSKDILLAAFKSARKKGAEKTVVLVIENLEAIFENRELMAELGSIILLVDDEEYAKHSIKILIVGVPAEIIEYYQSISYLETVSNRIHELPTVYGLNSFQIQVFVRKGFVTLLQFEFPSPQLTEITAHVEKVTLGIPQRMHEYCELLAYNIQDSANKYDSGLLEITDGKYLNMSLKKAHSVIVNFMNERKAKNGRRNQVIFALGKTKVTEFDSKHIESLIRQEFPVSTQGTVLAVGQMMADLSKGDAPLLRKLKKSTVYRFADPRYLMCIRVMVRRIPGTDKIIRATFKR